MNDVTHTKKSVTMTTTRTQKVKKEDMEDLRARTQAVWDDTEIEYIDIDNGWALIAAAEFPNGTKRIFYIAVDEPDEFKPEQAKNGVNNKIRIFIDFWTRNNGEEP